MRSVGVVACMLAVGATVSGCAAESEFPIVERTPVSEDTVADVAVIDTDQFEVDTLRFSCSYDDADYFVVQNTECTVRVAVFPDVTAYGAAESTTSVPEAAKWSIDCGGPATLKDATENVFSARLVPISGATPDEESIAISDNVGAELAPSW